MLLGRPNFALKGRKIVRGSAPKIAKICGMRARSPVAARLGKRVAELRLQNGMGQKELAADADTTVKVISQLERGISVPSVEKLDVIASAVNMQLADLFVFDDEMSDRRHSAFVQINYLLRGRTARDLEAVRDLLKLVFEIKRRERPASETSPARRRGGAVMEQRKG